LVFDTQYILSDCLLQADGAKLVLFAEVASGVRSGWKALAQESLKAGFVRARLDGAMVLLDEFPVVDVRIPHRLEVVLDRLKASPDNQSRLREAIENGFKVGKGIVLVELDGKESRYTSLYRCMKCGRELLKPVPELFSPRSVQGACSSCKGLGCTECAFEKLREEARSVRIQGLSLPALLALPVPEALAFCQNSAPPAIQDDLNRLLRLMQLGLGYLSLSRSAESLSQGELLRARLVGAVGSGLSGLLYVLEEPFSGLGEAERSQLLLLLKELVAGGSTVLVIDHARECLEAAERVVELGPGAGKEGGRVIFSGKAAELGDTATGQWWRDELKVMPLPKAEKGFLTLHNPTGHNLKGGKLILPLGELVGVSGPSGSGKSSLLLDTLVPALKKQPGLPFECLEGSAASILTLSSASRSIKNLAAGLCGLWSYLQQLLSQTQEAQAQGFGPEIFALRGKGACSECKGLGVLVLQGMEQLCISCKGKRFNAATLSIHWRGHSPAQLLSLTVTEARRLFEAHRFARRVLVELEELGLGGLKLDRRGDQLSPGEHSRLLLARALARNMLGSLLVLDEPSLGLHPLDRVKLAHSLQRLVQHGATVVVVDHDPVLLGACSTRLALGPGSGPEGGVISCL
jgi:excinuclease ABC subunit A